MIMVTVKIKENSKQAKIVLEMLKTFSFVEVVPTETNTQKKTAFSKKSVTPKVLLDLDLAFKQLEKTKQSNSTRKTLDELLNEK
jgi:hypothetical protein